MLAAKGINRKLKYSSSVNMIFHGNSITAGYSVKTEERFTTLVQSLWPLSGASVTVTNGGVSGHTWEQLASTDMHLVSSALSNSKTNIVVSGENTNSIGGGDSASQCLAAIAAYKTALFDAFNSVSPAKCYWILETAIPSSTMPEETNQVVNASLLSDYRAIGASMCIDWRPPNSPFDGANPITSPLYIDTVHPTAYGHTILAQLIANQLGRLSI